VTLRLVNAHELFAVIVALDVATRVLLMLQSLLIFWHQVCQDCPENIKLIVNSPIVTKNIAFNYIL